MNKRIIELHQQIIELENQIKREKLLDDIWVELGPYTDALTCELRYRLQDYFNFDDSE